jgi:hypothetical protein
MKTCVNLVFPKDAYISVDFLEKKCEVVKMKDAQKFQAILI